MSHQCTGTMGGAINGEIDDEGKKRQKRQISEDLSVRQVSFCFAAAYQTILN